MGRFAHFVNIYFNETRQTFLSRHIYSTFFPASGMHSAYCFRRTAFNGRRTIATHM